MITDIEYQAWLQDPAATRVLLVDLQHADGWEYVASRPYITRPSDSAPNRIYRDLLIDAAGITVRLDAVPEVGDLLLVDDGSIASWVDRRWRGFSVILRLGDPAWSFDDFRVIARQRSAGILSASRGELRMGVHDATALLDVAVDRPLLPNGQPTPLILGHVLGVSAVRISDAALQYRVSQLPLSALTVRDGTGPLLTHTPNLGAGEFLLASYTPRTLWCDATEPHLMPALIVQWVAGEYGISVADDVSLPEYEIGLYYTDVVTGRQILDDLCAAIGARWSINLLGELDVRVFDVPSVADLVLTADDIELGGVTLTATEEPVRQLVMKYAENKQPLTEVAGSIEDSAPALAERLRQQWLSESVVNSLPDYPLAAEQEVETALQSKANATAECQRRQAIRSQRRDIWELKVFLPPDAALVGKGIEVLHPRLSGRIGRIIRMSLNPIRETATIEVWY